MRNFLAVLAWLFAAALSTGAQAQARATSVTDFIAVARAERNHYVKGFKASYEQWCKHKQNVCAAELLVRPNSMSVPDPYALVRLDMVANLNSKFEASRHEQDRPLQSFPRKSFAVSPSLRLNLSPFVWNRVEFRSVVAPRDIAPLTKWANKWIDVADTKPTEMGQFIEVIHSVVYPSLNSGTWQFMVDFGTAQPEALSELLLVLERMGLREVHVGSFSPMQ
jgi:hypothetical protein